MNIIICGDSLFKFAVNRLFFLWEMSDIDFVEILLGYRRLFPERKLKRQNYVAFNKSIFFM